MADALDPAPAATAGIQALQDSINKMNGMLIQSGADVIAMTAQIRALVARQSDIRFVTLRALEVSAANRQAITALNEASQALSDEARSMGIVATALNDAARVVSAAGSLIAALAPFGA
jgi:hypothetical protein